MAIELEPFRPPTDRERALVDFLLTEAITGAAQFAAQAATMVVALNCSCGCESLAIRVDEDLATSPWRHATTPGAWHRDLPIEAMLFTRGGRLTGLEVTAYAGEPIGLPDPADLRFPGSDDG